MDSLYTPWLSQHTTDGQDPVTSTVNVEWKDSSTASANSAAVGQSTLEVSDFSLGADLPVASSSSSPIGTQPTPFFQYNQQSHNFWPSPAAYNAVPYAGTSWAGTPSQLPLSSYSSLNGATSTHSSHASGSSSQMVIDPALTTVNTQASRIPHVFNPAHYPPPSNQHLQYNYHQQSHALPLSINPSFMQTNPAHFQVPRVHNRSILPHVPPPSPTQGTLSPFVLQAEPGSLTPPAVVTPTLSLSAPVASLASPAPTPEQLKERLLSNLRPFLQPSSFSGARAVTHLAELVKDFGILEVDPQTRLEIATKIRDNAGNHYFRAWLENALAMDITQEWLRACVGKDDPQLQETIMPLLQILDRLPMSVMSLRNNKLGKIVVRLGKDAPTPAIKDMASNLERRWRLIIAGQNAKETDPDSGEDAANKKRKGDPVAAKGAPPTKRIAVSTTPSAKPVVKKESSKSGGKEVKDAKSDSSFFSAPKPKPKLPSFKKAPLTIVKKEPDLNVAQPSSHNPFQEALLSMAPKATSNSPVASTPPFTSTAQSAPPPLPPPTLTTRPRKAKSVSWAPEGQLEMVKMIERAIYDDDPADGGHITHSLRDLDRGEGAALHVNSHLFEEQVDWFEPQLLEMPPELDVPEKGKDSLEKTTQDEREQSALGAVYMSPLHIPESPAEPITVLPDEQVDLDIRMMLTGTDAEAVFGSGEARAATPEYTVSGSASVAELVGQLSGDVAMSDAFLSQSQSLNVDTSTMPSVQGLSQIAADPEQFQQMMQLAQAALLSQPTAYTANRPPVADQEQSWPMSGHTEFERGLSDEGGRDRRWSGEETWYDKGRGRSRGRGRGRGDGFRQTRRKPCSFFAAGRCKYGDQCDFSHEPNH